MVVADDDGQLSVDDIDVRNKEHTRVEHLVLTLAEARRSCSKSSGKCSPAGLAEDLEATDKYKRSERAQGAYKRRRSHVHEARALPQKQP